ncbi:MAG: hypothetical protein FWF79_03600, partial [Defluviitaleaceae bacterium]|nr:hypothetical protein [Defluviitaleaceae bacterium]
PQAPSLQWAKPTSAPPPLAAHRTSCGEKMRRMRHFYCGILQKSFFNDIISIILPTCGYEKGNT